MKAWDKQVHAAVILLLFLVFQWAGRYFKQTVEPGVPMDQRETASSRRPHVTRHYNTDASLSTPFLDKVNEYWITKGEPQIRNYGDIKLTTRGRTGQYGIVMSNGVGDNILDDFEVVISFTIYYDPAKQKDSQHLMGDGMAIVITPEKNFISQNMMSSYARKQYEHNSGGIMGNDRSMMGFPKNLPGLALVVDTYRNDKKTKLHPPFLSLLLNVDPRAHCYSQESDGESSTGYRLAPLMKLKKSVLTGQETKLRIIYLESIGFLKIDIAYSSDDQWIELYQKDTGMFLPKNKKTGQRFIGVGASTGEMTQTVEVKRVDTSEFHWDGHEEDKFDYVEEIKFFLAYEYGEHISMDKDDFNKWKLAKIKGNEANLVVEQHNSGRDFVSFSLKWSIILVSLYVLSVYVRVSLKRARMVKHKHTSAILG